MNLCKYSEFAINVKLDHVGKYPVMHGKTHYKAKISHLQRWRAFVAAAAH
eukprot:COSAG05_NODE_16912_length_336_cov_0.654008_1_plen_49_part_01